MSKENYQGQRQILHDDKKINPPRHINSKCVLPNNDTTKCMKQKLTELKGKIENQQLYYGISVPPLNN